MSSTPINKTLRGIRDSIPGGYILGRTGKGNGPPILLPLSTFTTPGYVANTTIQVGQTAGGDLSGTYPNPTVARLQGRDLAATVPTDGQSIVWSAVNNDWEPGSPAVTGGVPGLDKIIDRFPLDLVHGGGVSSGGGGGGSTNLYTSVPYTQQTNSNAFATKGNIFTPLENITIQSLDAIVIPASGNTFKFSIVQFSVVGTTYTVSSQLAVSASNIATSGTVPQRITDTLSANLTAGNVYGLLITGTNLAGGTTSCPVGVCTSLPLIHDAYTDIIKGLMNITASFYDRAFGVQFASITPPTSGSSTNQDSYLSNIGFKYTR